MSEEVATPPDSITPGLPEQSAPRVRRISNPRPKKVAKVRPAPETKTEKAEPVEEIAAAPDLTSSDDESENREGEAWPEPEAASEGSPSQGEGNNKRKRHRRKGKGQSSQSPPVQSAQGEGEAITVINESAAPAAPVERSKPPGFTQPPPTQGQGQPQAHRQRLDPELLAKNAWKIFLAEVSEEGVALIGDNDAKDLARRCFRLAEIFMEEQGRRR